MIIKGNYTIANVKNRHTQNIIRTSNLAKESKINKPDFLLSWEISSKTDNQVTK